jgi:hypothetical protein
MMIHQMVLDQPMPWIEKFGIWSSVVSGPSGQPDLRLLVYPDPGGAKPWTWEIVEADEFGEWEMEVGAAPTLQAAKASVQQWAAVYCDEGQVRCPGCNRMFDLFMSNGCHMGLCRMCFED